jgi:Secretion system C-terminal sorting domain
MKKTILFLVAVLMLGAFIQAPLLHAQVDSISNGCPVQDSAVIGSGGAKDFVVTSQTWPSEPFPPPSSGYKKTVAIKNICDTAITIDSAWWPDQVHFRLVTSLPITIPAYPDSALFTIAYFPGLASKIFHDVTFSSWTSPEVLEADGKTPSPRSDSLIGWAAAPSGVSEENNSASTATIIPTNDGRSLTIIPTSATDASLTIELVNVLGENILRETFSAGTQNVDASSLPHGVYFYRLTTGSLSQSGKVILGE